jgi:RNA polymerase sigma-70 factor (ECF subfamily)
MTATSDEDIVRAVQSGRKDAYAELVNRHKDTVYGVLRRLLRDPDVAEELAHETFVRAWRGLGAFRGEALFSTWLVQIAVHLARDRVRERQRSRTVSLDELLDRDADDSELPDSRSYSDPLAEIAARDTARRLESALEGLPATYREVFVLHHVNELPYDEIATITGDSVGSLKVRAHRARRLLREALFADTRRGAREDIVE